MEQFKQFNIEKQAVSEKLGELDGILQELSSLGMNVDDGFEKIKSALNSINDDVLKIALLGAFSDGKTSVIASWLGHIMDDMNIDINESSDRIAVYKPEGLPEKCEIIDTPGLFGDKEKEVNGSQVMYSDLTKQYISEANIVLYVVDATNPLKESHNDIVKWVLRDLNKLSSTIFVINKMDEVTDLTEQVMFDQQAEIKKKTLGEKLVRAANLTAGELSNTRMVCMASNPGGRGLEFWFSKPEHYESRSRINDLKSMTTDVLSSNLPQDLITKTGMDVVSDLISNKVKDASQELDTLDAYFQQNKQETERIAQDIVSGKKQVKRLSRELYEELNVIENKLLSKLRALSLEDIKPFLEDEIGYNGDDIGYKLNLKIKTTIDRYFEQSAQITNQIGSDIKRHLDTSESFINSLSKSSLNAASGVAKSISKIPVDSIKTAIFTARDILGNLGVVIKFKPWEASKLAANLSKWSGPIGATISVISDLMSAYQEREQEQKLQDIKNDIGEMLKDTFKELYELMSDDEKTFDFFAPQLKEFEKILAEMELGSNDLEENRKQLAIIISKLNAINSNVNNTVEAGLEHEPTL